MARVSIDHQITNEDIHIKVDGKVNNSSNRRCSDSKYKAEDGFIYNCVTVNDGISAETGEPIIKYKYSINSNNKASNGNSITYISNSNSDGLTLNLDLMRQRYSTDQETENAINVLGGCKIIGQVTSKK